MKLSATEEIQRNAMVPKILTDGTGMRNPVKMLNLLYNQNETLVS